jgi:bifunctional non-homologous end joining protein LigD
MPLAWDELGEAIGPAWFTVMNAPSRLAHQEADPWGDFRDAAAPLPGAGPRRRRAA